MHVHLHPPTPRYIKPLEPFYDGFDPGFVAARKAAREILQKEDDLNEIVQLVGKVGGLGMAGGWLQWSAGRRRTPMNKTVPAGRQGGWGA